MEGPENYPDIDKLTTEPEFADVIDRLVITGRASIPRAFRLIEPCRELSTAVLWPLLLVVAAASSYAQLGHRVMQTGNKATSRCGASSFTLIS
jgi:hypothetical protein